MGLEVVCAVQAALATGQVLTSLHVTFVGPHVALVCGRLKLLLLAGEGCQGQVSWRGVVNKHIRAWGFLAFVVPGVWMCHMVTYMLQRLGFMCSHLLLEAASAQVHQP